MIMKRFSLREYISNPSQKVVTRNGKPVRILSTDSSMKYPILALVEYNGDDELERYMTDGTFCENSKSDLDLFFAPEQKERFDPHTLKPFDKILVRQSIFDSWLCDHFSFMNDDAACRFWCSSNYWCYCIPYNEETKHLVGTTDEAPEYYRYWEK